MKGRTRRKEGEHGSRRGRASATSGARALTCRPSGLSAASRTALHQRATCPLAVQSCSRRTTNPKPPAGRARLPTLLVFIGRGRRGLAVSWVTGGAAGVGGGRWSAPYCVASAGNVAGVSR